MFQRHPLFDHVLDTVADDHHDVAVIADIAGIADPTMARNDHGAALRHEFRYGQIHDFVQSLDLPVNAAAPFDIDWRVDIAVIDIAGNDDIRAAEPHGAVAIGRCVGQMKKLNGLIIEEAVQGVLIGNVSGVRNSVGCFEHPSLNFFMGENRLA